eukprot:CAMPEP_0196689168 /NCGR_PEP_ID=MMETSP1090-20130531/17706_1 /TAXON_ID=37098 /ORGANISM="Isochrysis sp, Strain CCMP1244" /LENGTH=192 /DNA_ID=CAMNT_0042028145 /DNA_START=58 /DNA_END=633 /DNA_ORIENTATION=+
MGMLDTENKDKIKKAAGYDSMKLFESRDVIKKQNGDYALAPGSTELYVGAYWTVTKNLSGPSIVLNGEAGLVKARTDPNKTTKPYAAVDVGIGQAEAHAKFSPAGFDVGAGVSLAGGSVSVFDFNIGAGVGIAAGINDDSVEVKVLGTGVTIGRKVGFSVSAARLELILGRSAKPSSADASALSALCSHCPP